MINRVAEVPYALGELISDAVVNLKDKEELAEHEYDLWYHDQPIWLVRKIQQLQDKVRVFRVQVTAFDTEEGIQLHAIPDAYVLDRGKVVTRCKPERIRQATLEDKLSSLSLQQLHYSVVKEGKEAAIELIFNNMLLPAWRSAKKLADEL